MRFSSIRRSPLLLLLTVGLVVCSSPVATRPVDADPRLHPGDAPDAAALRAALDVIRLRNGLPALGIALVRVDAAPLILTVGTRRLGTADWVDDSDVWHLGSNTKAVVATHVQQLSGRGEVSWSATLESLFPELATVMHPQYRRLSLRDVAAHRAAFRRDVSGPTVMVSDLSAARAAAVRQILTSAPVVAPGRFSYSNAGYVLLASVAERATGGVWEQDVQRDLFGPLNLTTANFGSLEAQRSEPWPHRVHGASLVPVIPGSVGSDLLPVLNSAGRLRMSLADWSRFVLVHLHAEAGVEDVLSPDAGRELHAPWRGILGDEGYAYGWFVHDDAWPGRVLQHGGTNALNYSLAWLAPERGFAVLAVTNAGGAAAEQGLVAAVEHVIALQQARVTSTKPMPGCNIRASRRAGAMPSAWPLHGARRS